MYNPFRAFHKKLKDQMFDEVQIVTAHVLFWPLSYLVAWAIIGLLGPYILMGLFSIAAVPFFWAILLHYLFTKQKKYFYIGVVGFITIFFLLSGIPGFTNGLFFEFLAIENVNSFYFKAIEIWWSIFNAINPLADNGHPRDFYKFPYDLGQIIFVLGGVVVMPFMFYTFVDTEKQEKIDAQNLEKKKIEEEEARQKWELEKKIRQEELEILEKQREDLEKKAMEEKERQKKESTNPDPWNSGFF